MISILLAADATISKKAADKASSTIIDQTGAVGAVLILVFFIGVPILWWILRTLKKQNEKQQETFEGISAEAKDLAERTAIRNAEIFKDYMDENKRINNERARVGDDATRAITMVATKLDMYMDTQKDLLEKLNGKSDN